MKKAVIIFGILVAIAIAPPLVVPIFSPWSGINCDVQEINIKTGQARYSRYLWFVKISEDINNTTISQELRGKTVDVTDIEPWHKVNTFCPWVDNSPHYMFHGAIVQAGQLRTVFELGNFSEQQRQSVASRVLTLWQTEGDCHGVSDYIEKLRVSGPVLSPSDVAVVLLGSEIPCMRDSGASLTESFLRQHMVSLDNRTCVIEGDDLVPTYIVSLHGVGGEPQVALITCDGVSVQNRWVYLMRPTGMIDISDSALPVLSLPCLSSRLNTATGETKYTEECIRSVAHSAYRIESIGTTIRITSGIPDENYGIEIGRMQWDGSQFVLVDQSSP